MSRSIDCPYCSADIPLEPNVENGEEVYCSYCECPVIVQRLDRDAWMGLQTEEWETIKKKRRKAEDKEREGTM